MTRKRNQIKKFQLIVLYLLLLYFLEEKALEVFGLKTS